jgi:hypothetical protein
VSGLRRLTSVADPGSLPRIQIIFMLDPNHPGSRICIKEFNCLTQEIAPEALGNMIRAVHLGSGSCPDPGIFSHFFAEEKNTAVS